MEEVFLATKIVGSNYEVVEFTCEAACPCEWTGWWVFVYAIAFGIISAVLAYWIRK